MLAFSATFSVLYPSSSNTVYPVLLLTYMLLLQEYVLWTVKCFAELEQRMINVDRCLKLLDVPQERSEGCSVS